MSLSSAFSFGEKYGKRPVTVLSPDVYVTLQGETVLRACGECQRTININDYVNSVSTDGSIDSPPGSATVNMTVPLNEMNDFYVNNELTIIPMMEINIYAKGYYLLNGVPKYYRIFWGLVSNVQVSFHDGVNSIVINCADILRWWELTTAIVNPSFLGGTGVGYQLFQNQFAGMNPYSVIAKLAASATGDMSYTTFSFTSYTRDPHKATGALGTYVRDNIMLYWRIKFQTIRERVVLYGMSGQAYPLSQFTDTSPSEIGKIIGDKEYEVVKDQLASSRGLRQSVLGMAAFKIDVSKAGSVNFFETEANDKLRIALVARDQAQFEFYCDCNGDIVFKPPFFNMSVINNKPVSWIFNHELIDDNFNDSEKEVYTHITGSGNAFGGVVDWGLNDEITTPHTGVFDFHLLKRYGWRRNELSVEWAGNPKKLFYHLLDYMDRVNAKRISGTVTIPMRPELKMGFPIYIEKHDAYFYIEGISHSYTTGGNATTSLTLKAKRSKFIPVSNIGLIKRTGDTVPATDGVQIVDKKPAEAQAAGLQYGVPKFEVSFDGIATSTTGYNRSTTEIKQPDLVVRYDKYGRLKGMPNVVMVLNNAADSNAANLADQVSNTTNKKARKAATKAISAEGLEQEANTFNKALDEILANSKNDGHLATIRRNRYEAALTNLGSYDYAYDSSKTIKEFMMIPVNNLQYNNTQDVDSTRISELQEKIRELEPKLTRVESDLFTASGEYTYETVNRKGARKAEVAKAANAVAKYSAEKADLELQLSELKGLLGTLKLPTTKNFARTVMVKPVSDEEGFEVIGHYRYGRGVNPATLMVGNEVISTAMPLQSGQYKTTNGQVVNEASLGATFEKMTPAEDTPTLRYEDLETNNANAPDPGSVPSTIYLEADSRIDAMNLADLQPTENRFNGLSTCATCMPFRFDFISVLPENLRTNFQGSNANFWKTFNEFQKGLFDKDAPAYQTKYAEYSVSNSASGVPSVSAGSGTSLSLSTLLSPGDVVNFSDADLYRAAAQGDQTAIDIIIRRTTQNEAEYAANANYRSKYDQVKRQVTQNEIDSVLQQVPSFANNVN